MTDVTDNIAEIHTINTRMDLLKSVLRMELNLWVMMSLLLLFVVRKTKGICAKGAVDEVTVPNNL